MGFQKTGKAVRVGKSFFIDEKQPPPDTEKEDEQAKKDDVVPKDALVDRQ